ncbi:MAG: hypothetical protein AMJ75_03735 [Phycisphaerae bacterium SM1_79]|nr:MAG: hypothetical protein AMJ75_03735 [Phycisphaerae bacterium SM1_79]
MLLHKGKIGLLFAAVVLFCLGATVQVDALTIAQDGEARAVIIIAPDSSEPEKHAAAELAEFLKQITGGKFEILHKDAPGQSRILVGLKAANLTAVDFYTDGLGSDGIIIRTLGKDLVLVGGEPRGTLYAVYTFLEDHVGCRWWSSKVSTIPKKPTLKVGELNIRHVPPLEYRESFWFDAFDGDWAVRNKSNGNSERLDAKRGGKHSYQGFVHTFFPLIPPAKYFKDHPEWFSEIDGKRKHERAQLCLTNEEVRKELVKNLKARLRSNPAATIASVSQNDWHGYCQCNKCAAIDKEEGSPSGSLLHFVNAVAADIEEEFPNVAISTLAYQYTRKPPKKVKPRHNVIVRLCSIECSFSKPLADERNQKFRDDIVGWSKVCNRLYIWDYTTNFRHYVMPHPNLRVLGPNVKFFVDHNVKGIFEQGAYQSYGSEMAELRAWVLAKLLWDPKLDGRKLVDEFIEGYYGSAGPHIKTYLNVTHDAVEASGEWLGCFSQHTAKFLSLDTLCKGWEHLKAAEEAVKDNPALHFRVQVAQLPVMYVFMMRWDEMREKAKETSVDWPVPDTIKETYERFLEIAKRKNMTHLREGSRGFGVLDEAVERAKK